MKQELKVFAPLFTTEKMNSVMSTEFSDVHELVPTNILPQKYKDALAKEGGDSGFKVQVESSQDL